MTTDKFTLLKKIVEDYKLFYNYEKLISETKEFSSPAILLNNTASLISRLDTSLDKFPSHERLNILNYIYPTMVNYGDKDTKSPISLAVKEYFSLQVSILNKDFKSGDMIVKFESKIDTIFKDLDILKNSLSIKILNYEDALRDVKERGIKEDISKDLIERMQEMVKNLTLAQQKVDISISDFKQVQNDLNSYQENIDKLKKLNFKINLQIFKPNSETINEQNKLLTQIKGFENTLRDKSFKIQSAVNQFFDKNLIDKTNLLLQKTSNGKDVLENSKEIVASSSRIKDFSERGLNITKENMENEFSQIQNLDIENKIKKEIVILIQQSFNGLFVSNELEEESKKVRTTANKKIVENLSIRFE